MYVGAERVSVAAADYDENLQYKRPESAQTNSLWKENLV